MNSSVLAVSLTLEPSRSSYNNSEGVVREQHAVVRNLTSVKRKGASCNTEPDCSGFIPVRLVLYQELLPIRALEALGYASLGNRCCLSAPKEDQLPASLSSNDSASVHCEYPLSHL
jgi:hypothetical protein